MFNIENNEEVLEQFVTKIITVNIQLCGFMLYESLLLFRISYNSANNSVHICILATTTYTYIYYMTR